MASAGRFNSGCDVCLDCAQSSSASVKQLKATAFTPSSESVEALRDYNTGLQLSRQGNYNDAAKSFEACIKEDETFALAYAKLGETYFNLSDGNQARQFARRAVDLSENLPGPKGSGFLPPRLEENLDLHFFKVEVSWSSNIHDFHYVHFRLP
jgi:tetratricopeptide (TPR) repeat protein